ncbi:hypothetical protein [Maritimibacter sp. DP1N21-5]|uniref:hypothetical protein n=1 Tax=Maritimibacter sp. DP1N21-5 TaxID=2836867 RepID=UPI001C4880CA|nr:hypothetical protein [Maritimibacter sp. DP1N21-5]MBV7409435.1 hypothetical protein [Maritimibacter sp. DP1N21-5]
MLLGWLATPATGQDLPDLQTCLNSYVDDYEWLLEVHADDVLEDIEGGIWHVEEVPNCVTMAIMICDAAEASYACQRDLADEERALAEAIRAGLPDPDRGGDGWAKRLYAATYDLAHGISAGDDCAGTEDPMTSWCLAREEGNRLRDAVSAWQVARYLDLVPPATEAGWAGPPPPLRPLPRPEGR